MDPKSLILVLFLLLGAFVSEVDSWWTSRRRRRRCSASNCLVSGWSSWGGCSRSCGSSGTQGRNRRVTRVASCGGSCYHLSESRACNRVCCPVNCAWNWNNWGSCQGCGTGTRTRTVAITTNPSCNGAACPGTRSQTQSCNTGRCCPVNCVTSNWGSWGSCNAQCEKVGVRSRTRTATTAASCNGIACPGLTQYNTCNGPCCRRDCTLSSWSSFGTCSAPAGSCSPNSGTHSRSRTQITAKSCGGGCFPLQESKTCTPTPITCQVSPWGVWSTCTPKTGNCGAGSQSRTRTITRQPYCSSSCPATSGSRDCVHSCCPVNCVLSQWTPWGQCSANCGTGLQQRTRRVTTPASCNGVCSSNLAETKQCTVINKVDCQMNAWSGWSVCSSGCGNGLQQRTRTIKVQPTVCGQSCGNVTDIKQCQSYRENRNCQVSSWQQWGDCDSKCSIGTKTRVRKITVSQRCRGSVCPTLKDTSSCGLINGGCEQICQQSSGGTCRCLPGYEATNRTHCQLKDCGQPKVNYCPPGEANGTVCVQPWIQCASGKTLFRSTCMLSCPSTHILKGVSSITCDYNGLWFPAIATTYCRRINDPPSNIILSGNKRVDENSPRKTFIGSLSSTDVNANDNHTYTMVTVAASLGKFEILGSDLYTMVSFDYETEPKSYTVGIKSTDNGNPALSLTKYFTISIGDVNEQPTNIVASSLEVAENSDIGTVVAVFDTVDVDAGQINTYRLINSSSDIFRIINNTLQVAAANRDCLRLGSDKCPLNWEARTMHSIRVVSNDDRSPSLSITRDFNITVTNQNDPPYDIRLTGNTVKESSAHGTTIGRLSAVDEDVNPKQAFVFSLSNDDNGRFGVTGNGTVYKTNDTDYETDNSHQIQVKVTDSGAPPASNFQNFTIIVLDVNEPPVNITLSSTGSDETFPDGQPIVYENVAVGTVIGSINAFDSDFITGLNLTLDDDAGGRFKVAETQNCSHILNEDYSKTVCRADLLVNGELNFEKSSSHAVIVRAEDRGHFIHRAFTVELRDANDPPHGLLIDGKTSERVNENLKGATIGRLVVLDEDKNQTHSLALVNDDNGTFVLDNDILSLASNVSLDYEAKQSYEVKFTVSDDGIPVKSAVLGITVKVTNVNEAPTDIRISGNSVDENSPEGTLVANISVVDPDDVNNNAKSGRPVCTLTDAANDRLKIVSGLELVVGPGQLDYEAASNHSVTVQCSDGALTVTKSFTININDINERPTSIQITNNKIEENQSGRILIGYLSTIDPDNQVVTHQSFKYSIPKNTSAFRIEGNALYCDAPFDFEKTPSADLTIVTQDDGSPPLKNFRNLRIEITDGNDAPTDVLISNNKLDENSAMDTPVGALSTVDEDTNQAFVYYMADGAQGRFKIEGNVVKVASSVTQCLKLGGNHCMLDYETSKNHVIQVKTTDNGSPPKSCTKNITIQLNDINDRPRDIMLSNYKVAENASVDFVIGRFNFTDEDEGQKFTFRLSQNDSGRFGVDDSGNLYKASNETNYETDKSHRVTVVVTDNGNPPLESSRTFVIEVLDVNEAPIKTVLTSKGGQLNFTENNARINENSKIGTVIGSIVSYDSEPTEKIQFKLDDAAGGIFKLADNVECKNTTMVGARSQCSVNLVLSGAVDYETQSSHWIIVRSTDNEGLFQIAKFSVDIVDQNDAPTGILIGGLKYAIVAENQAGTLIDRLTTIDQDSGQSHVYDILGNNSAMYKTYSVYVFLSRGTVFDYEKQTKHFVTINSTDSGQPRKSVVETLELRVEDANEAPTEVTLSNSNVLENSPKGTVVGNISVADPDNLGRRGMWQRHQCVVTSGSSGMLRVQGQQLIVAHNGIDYEKADSYNISLRCEDSGIPTRFIEKWFVVSVEDVNEKPTSISISSDAIPENSPAGTGIGLLSTTDPDNVQASPVQRYRSQRFSYTILNNGTGLPFTIGKDNVLRTTRKLDFEHQTSWTIDLRSFDTGKPVMSVDGQIIVNVTDVNEQPTNLTLSSTKITENSGLGALVGLLSTSDPDVGQSFSYSLPDSAGGLFRIIANRLEVAASNRSCLAQGKDSCLLNFEKNQLLNIRVKCQDNGVPVLSTEKQFQIQLVDINDRPRDLVLSSNRLPENATKGHLIGQLSATDEDVGQNLTFTLTDDDSGRFQLNKDAFIIKAKDTNYEAKKIHKIKVEVSDDGNPKLTISKEFVIIIEDVNEAPTRIEITSERGQVSFNKNAPRVNENSDKGTIIGTLLAYDEDLVERLTFTLDDDSNGTFSLRSPAVCSNTSKSAAAQRHTICKVLLIVAGSLDYETSKSVPLIVRATDNNGLQHSQAFTVAVIDQNDRPTDVTVNGGHVGFVNENEKNAAIATLETEDEDNSQTHSYRIVHDSDLTFIISGSKLYTSPHASLNYEKKKRYNILIESTDNGSPPLSFQQNITVQVLDVNEAPTAIQLTNNHVKENSVTGTIIANITVVDPDNEGEYARRQRAACSITSDSSGIFEIKDQLTLAVRKEALNYERMSSYAINIRCTDSGLPPKSLEQTFTVIVDDVNEAPTSIMLTDGTVRENQNNALVGRLVVSDPDRTRQTFRLTVQDRNSPFRVVGASSLKTIRPLDFEQQYEYIVSIRAVDQGGLSVTENFTIHVQDQNDAPSSIMFTGPLSIEEGAPAGSIVATASALDEDFHQTHQYSNLSVIGWGHGKTRNLQGYFTIVSSNGKIVSTTSAIDYEEYAFFNMSVTATDNGAPRLSVTRAVTIKVTDVNHPPTDIQFNGRNVVENSPSGTLIGNFTVIDPDNKYSERQTFACVLDNAVGVSVPFTITKRNSLAINGVVDYEQKQFYSIQVTCTENHARPYNITKNFVVNVLNVNEAPTAINLTSNTIPENQSPGGFIGTVVAVDPDNKLTHVDNITIKLLSGLDGAAFRLDAGNSLIANQSFDYEQKNTYTVKFRATDSATPSLHSEETVDILILDMNDQPADITLSASVISENAKKDAIIGQFSTVDEDKGQDYAYTFINIVDNLAIRGSKLVVSGKLDFETEPSIVVNVKVTDTGSPPMSFQISFTITVTDANDAPSAISVTSYPVFENNTSDKLVANMKVIDEDGAKQTYSCSMVNNPGYFYFRTDPVSRNATMYITGAASLDFETRPVINATIQCSDNGVPPLSIQSQIAIEILDSNERPTRVMINGSDVVLLPENSPVGAVVGQLSCMDQDGRQSHTYTLETGGDVFKIDAELLLVKNNSVLNYEQLSASKRIPIRIKVTDNGKPSLSFAATLQVQVTDVNEAPMNVRMIDPIADRIPENVTIGTHVGELFCDNVEGFRQMITYELLNWNDVFSITEGHGPGKVSFLTIKRELDYAKQSQYNLTVKATDNGKPPLSSQAVLPLAVGRSDPCYTGELHCGGEICQRVNKTQGSCGCLKGYEIKGNKCVEIDDCKADCKYCDSQKKACSTKQTCSPCRNNATCIDKLLSYQCVCPPGFTDARCETNTDECLSKPCQFGTCFDLVNDYRCECDEGYSGRNCSVNIDECSEKRCLKGDCKDLIAGFSCSCANGVSGLLCNRRVTDCEPNPCGNRLCVPPSYKDASMSNGVTEPVCAEESHVVRLTFSTVPEDKDQLNKWKYIFRTFISTVVGIPYYSVDLSEDQSNGGVYYPTDIIMYPMKQKTEPSKVRRDVKSSKSDVLLPMVLKVNDKLVLENSFLRAMNISCAKIMQSSRYWVYCNAVYLRIKELGLTGEGGKKPTTDKATGPAQFFTTNNIYIIAGSAAGFILLVAVVLMVRARQRRSSQHRQSVSGDHLVSGDNTYFDAMERHLAKRVEDSCMESVTNPIYGRDEAEVEHARKMFSNPLYGAGIDHDDMDNDIGETAAEIDDHGGIYNPMYGQVAKLNGQPGDTDC